MDAVSHSAHPPCGRGGWAAVRGLLVVVAALVAAVARAAPGPSGPEATAPAVASSQRWVLSPQQRAAIEQERRAGGDAVEGGEGGRGGPWRVQGLAQPQHSTGSAWVNGQLVRAGDPVGEQVRVRAVRADRVVIERDGRLIALRPGQTLLPDGQVSDLLAPLPGTSAPAALMSKDLTGASRGQRSP